MRWPLILADRVVTHGVKDMLASGYLGAFPHAVFEILYESLRQELPIPERRSLRIYGSLTHKGKDIWPYISLGSHILKEFNGFQDVRSSRQERPLQAFLKTLNSLRIYLPKDI